MIQIIRPIPKHLDADYVQRLAGMSVELVRAHLHGAQLDRRDCLQREDRDRFDSYIEAAQFVLSESEPFETRIRRERADVARVQFYLDQQRTILADLEAQMTEHRMALDELCLMAQQAEVVA
jgi:hypothetical protein